MYIGISFFSIYSRYTDVSLKNDMWRKIWIRDIEGILMMLKIKIPKNEAKEDLLRIEPLNIAKRYSTILSH
jgi:ribosomal protein L31E